MVENNPTSAYTIIIFINRTNTYAKAFTHLPLVFEIPSPTFGPLVTSLILCIFKFLIYVSRKISTFYQV